MHQSATFFQYKDSPPDSTNLTIPSYKKLRRNPTWGWQFPIILNGQSKYTKLQKRQAPPWTSYGGICKGVPKKQDSNISLGILSSHLGHIFQTSDRQTGEDPETICTLCHPWPRMLKDLNLPSLQQRRNELRLILLFNCRKISAGHPRLSWTS